MLGDLSKQYESNGDPACISTGWGDAGGKSYGMYQFASNTGTIRVYIDWLSRNGYWFANSLMVEPVGTKQFDDTWKELGTGPNKKDFEESQHRFVKEAYYDSAVRQLKEHYFTAGKHSEVMQDVIWSRAVQYGPYQVVEMFESAVKMIGFPNLSYVDDKRFDAELIEAIYDVCHSKEWTNGSPSLREGLYARFDSEKALALNMLKKKWGVK